MDLSISTLCVYHQRDAGVVDLIRRNPSVRNWEILDDGYHRLDNNLLSRLKPLAAEGIRFTIHAPFSSMNPAEYDPRLRECFIDVLESSIYQAAELGATIEVIHAGLPTIFSNFYPEDATRICAQSLTRLVNYGRSVGVNVVIENGAGQYDIFNTLDKITRLLSQVEQADTCLDFGHACITGEMSRFITGQPRICHIHVHDNQGKRDEHLPAGRGSIDWREAIGGLKQVGYQGLLVAENHSCAEALESVAYLQQVLKDLDSSP